MLSFGQHRAKGPGRKHANLSGYGERCRPVSRRRDNDSLLGIRVLAVESFGNFSDPQATSGQAGLQTGLDASCV